MEQVFIAESCPWCGRIEESEENFGLKGWYVPCPAEDCLSHASLEEQEAERIDPSATLGIYNHLPKDVRW